MLLHNIATEPDVLHIKLRKKDYTMNTTKIGLMGQDDSIIDTFRDAIIGPTTKPKTLSQALKELSNDDAAKVQSMARITHMMAKTFILSQGYMTQSYSDLVKELHKGLRPDLQAIVSALLEEIEPVEIRQKPKPDLLGAQLSVYDRWTSQESKTAKRDAVPLDDTYFIGNKEPDARASNFLDRLIMSESSGNSQAEITIKDGRRYVGKLQMGQARLKDYQAATGKSFTQDEFKADPALQDEVALWHFKDIDQEIDALGDAAKGYDRDGLRSVAHLGGKGGMRKYIKSGGKYNPADELGTSLQDYYDKFSSKT